MHPRPILRIDGRFKSRLQNALNLTSHGFFLNGSDYLFSLPHSINLIEATTTTFNSKTSQVYSICAFEFTLYNYPIIAYISTKQH